MIFNMLVVWNLDTPTIIVLAMSTAIAQNIASKHRQPRIQIPQSLWSRSAVNYELQLIIISYIENLHNVLSINAIIINRYGSR